MTWLGRRAGVFWIPFGGGILGLAVAALVAPGWLVLGTLSVVTATWVLVAPRLAVPVLLVGLTAQDALARLLEQVAPSLATPLHSLDEIALLAAAVRVGILLAIGDRAWFRGRDWIWAVVFVAAGIASSALHWSGIAPALLGLALSCKFFGFLLLVLSVPWQPGDGLRLVRAVAWGAPVLLGTGLFGFVFRDWTTAHFTAMEGDVEYSRGGFVPFMVPFVNPGLYGWALAVTGLGAFALLIEGRARTALVPLVAAAAGVILSLRRRPLLGIPITLVGAITHLSLRQRAYAAAISALGVALFAYFGGDLIRATVADTIQSYLDPEARANTARGAMLGVGLVIAARGFPFGIGFGRFGGFASQRYYSSVYDDFGLSSMYGLSPDAPYYITDTYWPHLLGEVGVLGTVAMLALLLSMWLRARAVHREERLPIEVRLVGLFGALVLLEGLVESLGGPVFEVSLQAFVIALPVGMAIRLARVEATSGSKTTAPQSR